MVARRSFFWALATCFVLNFFLLGAEFDPLPSWNEGSSKRSILEFVDKATKEGGEFFVPKSERIATFDQDGTLWVEQPLYTQLFFALDRAGQKSAKDLSESEVEALVLKTHSGMSVDLFLASVALWLKEAKHPRFKRPFTDLVYQPMLEVMEFFRKNDFKVYIVSGGGQEFIRAYAEKVYQVPPEQVIGTAGKVRYEMKNGEPALIKLPDVLLIDDKQGKPEAINLIIGRRPIAAFGNSDGDREMLQWTQGGTGLHLEMLVHHDDAIREYAYDKDSKIGTFSASLSEEAEKKKWIIISMKKDWKIIFSWEKP